MDDMAKHVRRLVEGLAKIQDRKPSAVAARVGGSYDTYDRLSRGGSLSTATATRMLSGLRDQWPAGLDMPKMEGGDG